MNYNTIHPLLDTCGPITKSVDVRNTEIGASDMRNAQEERLYALAIAKAMESLNDANIFQTQSEQAGSLEEFHKHVGAYALAGSSELADDSDKTSPLLAHETILPEQSVSDESLATYGDAVLRAAAITVDSVDVPAWSDLALQPAEELAGSSR